MDHHFSTMVFGEPTAISRLHLLMTFENYDDQQADAQKCSILPKSQNCTNWLFRVHFSKVVKFVQFDAAISGGISAYWPSLTIEVREEIYAMRHDFIFDRLCFTRSKCGMTGKCAKAQELGINYVIDDDSEILWECFGRGKWVYPVRTQYQQHDWSRWNSQGCHRQWIS